MASEDRASHRMNDMQEAELERRYKLVRVDPQHIFTLFNQAPAEFVKVPSIDIPEKIQVCGVTFDPQYDNFIVRILSPEFPAIPSGEMIPYLEDVKLRMIYLYQLHTAGNPSDHIRIVNAFRGLVKALKAPWNPDGDKECQCDPEVNHICGRCAERCVEDELRELGVEL